MPRLLVAAVLFAVLPSAGAVGAAGVAPTGAGVASAPARPAKLGQCVGCHGERGQGRVAGTPRLAGQDALYLANALRAYRAGSRQAVPMNSIANTLQPRDIDALSRWFAAQPAGTR